MGNSCFEWECLYCGHTNTEDISLAAPERDGTMNVWCGQCEKRARVEIEVKVQKITGFLACMIDREEQ